MEYKVKKCQYCGQYEERSINSNTPKITCFSCKRKQAKERSKSKDKRI